MDYQAYYDRYIDVVNSIDLDDVDKAVQTIKQARQVFVCGNGGSSAIASHLVNDLVKIAGVRAISLTDNIPLITAIANDIHYSEIFDWQLKRSMTKEDVLVCISGSGMSENVLRAAYEATRIGARVITLTGADGGKLYDWSDVPILLMGAKMTLAESAFSFICHMIAEGVIDE